jgi:valyl-tRNA synthetase
MGDEYNFKEAEEQIRQFWEKEKIYKFKPGKGKIFSIDTPPPTVSGKMHIGHAFSYSQQDFVVRYRRMKGDTIFYPFGTDDNGLPTERLVEKSKGIKAKDMSREEFIKICMDFLKVELPKFIQDWKNIGISCDFDIYYSTINEHCRKISQWSFLDLYGKKRLYRKDAPSMWCPECQTGVAQVEIKDKEIDSEFVYIRFKADGKDLIIATTRPELLPACVAIFYNPKDDRFKKLKGKKAKVPLFNIDVPIMEDERVSQEKGTGIVMCCTFGDQTDMEWQKAYNLVIKEAITKNGKMTELAGRYAKMGLKEARRAIIDDLEKNNLLVKKEKIKHFVNVHERCETEIEFVKSKQWFVKCLDLKEKMLDWGKKLNWYPEHMKHRYDNWVKGLQWDWLISNQRYFGVPFPVWYCKKCGEVVLANEEDLPINPLKDKPRRKCRCGGEEFEGEKDILNTWFTSSMTPRLAIQLMPSKIQEKLFPMSLRPQAHEIITFWLFNTVLKSNLHYNKNPFKDVMISGFVTLKGEKMAKSKGNIIESQEVLERYGADALRYWASSSKLGEDLEYQEKELVAGKKFVTKIFNSARFIFMNLKQVKKPGKIEEVDRLFLSKLNKVIKIATGNFEKYEYARCREAVSNFFWHDFCDNYLELVKNRVYNGSKEEKESAFYTLYYSLLTILKLMAPITPFITEALYQKYYKEEKEKSIHTSKWPEKFSITEKKNDEEKLELLLGIISGVRQEKTKKQKSLKSEIILTIEKKDKEKLKDLLEDLKAVTNSKEIKEGRFKVEFV